MPPSEEQMRQLWHEMWNTGREEETPEVRQQRIFKSLTYDLFLAIDEFGYEAVYFGVACAVFPEAVDPWEGNDH